MIEQTQVICTTAQLVELRHRLGITQNALAEALGLTTRAYQNLEAGRAKIRLVHSLALELISLRHAIRHVLNEPFF